MSDSVATMRPVTSTERVSPHLSIGWAITVVTPIAPMPIHPQSSDRAIREVIPIRGLPRRSTIGDAGKRLLPSGGVHRHSNNGRTTRLMDTGTRLSAHLLPWWGQNASDNQLWVAPPPSTKRSGHTVRDAHSSAARPHHIPGPGQEFNVNHYRVARSTSTKRSGQIAFDAHLVGARSTELTRRAHESCDTH